MHVTLWTKAVGASAGKLLKAVLYCARNRSQQIQKGVFYDIFS